MIQCVSINMLGIVSCDEGEKMGCHQSLLARLNVVMELERDSIHIS